ncbi:MAG TPA: TolC family protein, partial [Thermoanaerobaculia bacterium]|nr:TolC family protein [Thermoanaerobaculia bacterium]
AQDLPTPPATLSLREAIQLARENNPAFLQQRNDIDVARSSTRAAFGGLLPQANASTTFGYTAPGELRFQSRVLGTEPEAYFSSYNLGMQFQLDGNTLLQPSVQRAQQRAVERRVTGSEANLAAQVADQYLTVLQAREQTEQARREIARADEYVRLAQARLEVGAGTPLDVRRAEVQKGRAEVNLVQFRNAAAIAVLTLGQLTGITLEPEVQLTSEFEIFDPEWQVEEMVEMAMQNNPLLLASRASSSAARTQVAAARSSFLPTLNFNVGWRGYVNQYGTVDPLVDRELENINFEGCQRNNRVLALIGEGPQTCLNPADPAVREAFRQEFESQNRGFPFDYLNQPWQAAVTVSLPVFTGFNRQLQIDQAKATAADARHQVRAEELRVRQEVGSAIRNLETAHETVLLQEEVRENASEELRLAQERFRFGAASSVEVTDAQTNLAQAERDLIDAVYNFHKALATLEALVGRPLRSQ